MIGPHRALSSETHRASRYMFIYHSYIVLIPRYTLDMPSISFDMPRYEIDRDRMTSNDFALRYSRLARIIMASCTSPILPRVIVTGDEYFKHSMRTTYTISNSIRSFFDIYTTYGLFTQVLLDRLMTSVSFFLPLFFISSEI